MHTYIHTYIHTYMYPKLVLIQENKNNDYLLCVKT